MTEENILTEKTEQQDTCEDIVKKQAEENKQSHTTDPIFFEKIMNKESKLFVVALVFSIVNMLDGLMESINLWENESLIVALVCHVTLVLVIPIIHAIIVKKFLNQLSNDASDIKSVNKQEFSLWAGWISIFSTMSIPIWGIWFLVIPHESHGGDLNLDGLLYFFYIILVLVLYIIGSIISLVQEKRVIKASKLGNESSFSVSKTFKVSYFLKIACMCIVVALIILCVSNIFF